MAVLFSILMLALLIGALIDIITRRDDQVKHLPKVFWIILVILVPLAGSLIWFLVGREYDGEGIRLSRRRTGAAARSGRRRRRRRSPPTPARPSSRSPTSTARSRSGGCARRSRSASGSSGGSAAGETAAD